MPGLNGCHAKTDYKAVLAPFALRLDGVGRSIFPTSRVCVLPSNSERVWS
nr:MAG TPA: hypothetical protein [Caudoviricetes sp.]